MFEKPGFSRRDLIRSLPLLGVAASFPFGAGTAQAQGTVTAEMNKIIEAAKKEGTVSVYSSITESGARALGDAFTKKYGIAVEQYLPGSSVPIISRLQAELRAGKPGADVVMITGDSIYAVEKDLITKRPPMASQIDKQYHTGRWTTVRLFSDVVGYNSRKIDPANAPKSWEDLADSKYRGRVALGDALSVTTPVAWYVMVKEKYGDSYLKALAANKPRIYGTGTSVAQAIAAGEADIGWTYDYLGQVMQKAGAPLNVVFPAISCQTRYECGALTKAAHPNAAFLLYDFACTAEGQEALNGPLFSTATNPAAKVAGSRSVNDIPKSSIYPLDIPKMVRNLRSLQEEYRTLFGSKSA